LQYNSKVEMTFIYENNLYWAQLRKAHRRISQ
jgi:hypothetical protein